MTDNKHHLIEKINSRAARVGVIGLGYVGLPLVVEFAKGGFTSTGFEVDERKAGAVNRGESYIPDVSSKEMSEGIKAGKLSATTDFSKLNEQDVIIICVPTPLRKTKDPDVSYILSASEKIRENLRSGQLIILESTTYPGTTDEVLRPMFDETGLKLDQDYFLGFSPERVDPGNEKFNTKNIPKVVGGVTDASTDVAAAVYNTIVDTVHRASSARVAETCKLLENTFRAVNIGLVNELAQLCHTLGIDTWEVIAAAATKPFGFMPFYPGPGIGGHCLVGKETVIVRSTEDNIIRVETLESLFAAQRAQSFSFIEADGCEVIFAPKLEALSLNTQTGVPEWQPLTYLFRRSFAGNLVAIATSDNRTLTVTDEHPMLVCETDGQVREVFAKNLEVGQRLPIHCNKDQSKKTSIDYLGNNVIDLLPLIPMQGYDQILRLNGWLGKKGEKLQTYIQEHRRISESKTFKKFGNLITVPIKSIETITTEQPVDVYSIEVDNNHTFATSYGIFVHNCIPLDPHYLSWKARMHGFEARFISLAEEVNSRMPEHVVSLITQGLNQHRKAVNGSKILIMGVAYKRNITDMRESPALSIIEQLLKIGGEVSFHDPFVPEIHLEGVDIRMKGIELTDDVVKKSDCIVIVTDHSNIDYASIASDAQLIVDTRNTTRYTTNDKIIRL